MDREAFRQALWHGANPEGQFDVSDEDREAVLVELGLIEAPVVEEPEVVPAGRKRFKK